MPIVLNFSRRGSGKPLDGIVIPTTRETYASIRRGNSCEVDADAFTELKRLHPTSEIYFLVDGGSDDATLRGIYTCEKRPEMDCDQVKGGIFVKFWVKEWDTLQISEADFKAMLPNMYFNDTQLYSDLDVRQLEQLKMCLPDNNPVMSSLSRRGGGYYGMPPYDGHYGMRHLTRYDEPEFERDPRWRGYGTEPHRRMQLPPEWRPEPRTNRASPVPSRSAEPERSVTLMVNATTQTTEDSRIVELEDKLGEAVVQIEALRRGMHEKEAKAMALQREIGTIRLTLFNQFQREAYGTDDDNSSVEERDLQPPAALDSAHLSPRSTYGLCYSPRPPPHGARVSPLPNENVRPGSPHAQSSLIPLSLLEATQPETHIASMELPRRAPPVSSLPLPIVGSQPQTSLPSLQLPNTAGAPFGMPPGNLQPASRMPHYLQPNQPYPFPAAPNWGPLSPSLQPQTIPPRPPRPAVSESAPLDTQAPPVFDPMTGQMALIGGLHGGVSSTTV